MFGFDSQPTITDRLLLTAAKTLALLASTGVFAIIFLTLTGCVNRKMERNLAQNAATQRSEFSAILEKIRSEPSTPIGWDEAYRRVMQDNPSLQRSRVQLKQANRQTRKQWFTLAPRLAAFINIGDSISSLTDLSGDDISASLIANLNIPNPFDFYAGLYAAALQRQNAEWSHELDKRRACIELHYAYTDQLMLNEMESSFSQRVADFSYEGKTEMTRDLESLRTQIRSIERMRTLQRTRLNQLFNTPGAHWVLQGEPPHVDYRERIKELRIGDGFGKLALNLQAIQIEGAILNRERIKFRQWPLVSFGLNAPPLFSNQNDNAGFSTDEMWFFSGASKSFDLADPLGTVDLQDAEERLQFTREQLRSRIESEANQLLQARTTYLDLLAKEERTQARLQRIENSQDAEPVILLAEIEERAQLKTDLNETRRSLRQIDLQLLLWDDTHWK